MNRANILIKSLLKINTQTFRTKQTVSVAFTNFDVIKRLRTALFDNVNVLSKVEISEKERENREFICEQWNLYVSLKDEFERYKEARFLISKQNAMETLEKLCPKLAQIAKEGDNEKCPVNRQWPTITPPKKPYIE
ncbi:hypothetical protein ROZALSC1DRAFT_29881 [Rozella allomycis CSF55]|uniref:Large ribosomal subunit protein mL40 n=1 Tax=Rozella allomycis (strain CSF55) TaxID=988480 RepID=A0A075AXA8_ROZAC|nr:hypothetical protein O9G_001123 [Rozella allomycis CSF55]RKP18439.1 hypothetical protein ROZALSC1DRAFT_29881 [Rozella allomycis CSF55]|eukprot:EPZ33154.1 hypothetical protein O9G_001123 [Rozella allomycis CSF55]